MCEAHTLWNTNVRRQGNSPLLLPHQSHHVKCLTKFITIHPYDKGKHQYNLSVYHHATAILHNDTFFSIRKFTSTWGVPTQHIWFLGTSLDPLSFLPSLSYWVPRFLLKPSFWSPDSCLVASSVHLRSSSVHLRSSP
jgi:hypothetical protein